MRLLSYFFKLNRAFVSELRIFLVFGNQLYGCCNFVVFRYLLLGHSNLLNCWLFGVWLITSQEKHVHFAHRCLGTGELNDSQLAVFDCALQLLFSFLFNLRNGVEGRCHLVDSGVANLRSVTRRRWHTRLEGIKFVWVINYATNAANKCSNVINALS